MLHASTRRILLGILLLESGSGFKETASDIQKLGIEKQILPQTLCLILLPHLTKLSIRTAPLSLMYLRADIKEKDQCLRQPQLYPLWYLMLANRPCLFCMSIIASLF